MFSSVTVISYLLKAQPQRNTFNTSFIHNASLVTFNKLDFFLFSNSFLFKFFSYLLFCSCFASPNSFYAPNFIFAFFVSRNKNKKIKRNKY